MYDSIIFSTNNTLNGDCPEYEWEVFNYSEEVVQQLIDIINGDLEAKNWSDESHALYRKILLAMNKDLCSQVPYSDLDDAICMCDNLLDLYEGDPEYCNVAKRYFELKEKYDNDTIDIEDSLAETCRELLLLYLREEIVYDFESAEGY